MLKGLPETFRPFVIHVTQSEDKRTFAEREKLRSYEDVENMRATVSEDNVMKARAQFGTKDSGNTDIVCYKCCTGGHIACSHKQWCYD